MDLASDHEVALRTRVLEERTAYEVDAATFVKDLPRTVRWAICFADWFEQRYLRELSWALGRKRAWEERRLATAPGLEPEHSKLPAGDYLSPEEGKALQASLYLRELFGATGITLYAAPFVPGLDIFDDNLFPAPPSETPSGGIIPRPQPGDLPDGLRVDRLYLDHIRAAIVQIQKRVRSTAGPANEQARHPESDSVSVSAPEDAGDWNRALEEVACCIEAFLAKRMREPALKLNPEIHTRLENLLQHCPIGGPMGQLPISAGSAIPNERLVEMVKYLRELQTQPAPFSTAKERIPKDDKAGRRQQPSVPESASAKPAGQAAAMRELETIGAALPPLAWELMELLESCSHGQAPEHEVPQHLLNADLLRICAFYGVVTPCGVRLASRHESYDSGPRYGVTELGRTLLAYRRLSPDLTAKSQVPDVPSSNPENSPAVDPGTQESEAGGGDASGPDGDGTNADHRESTPTHSADFTSVKWFGTVHHFTKQQAAAIRVLWPEYEKGGFGLGEETIGDAVGSSASTFRMDVLFRDHAAFRTMIRKIRKGTYGLVRPEVQENPG